MKKKKQLKFVVKVYCSKCSSLLYLYKKEGAGFLLKCYLSGILKDYTKGNLKCHECGEQFARLARYHNRPAHKIISGKVYVKGGRGD